MGRIRWQGAAPGRIRYVRTDGLRSAVTGFDARSAGDPVVALDEGGLPVVAWAGRGLEIAWRRASGWQRFRHTTRPWWIDELHGMAVRDGRLVVGLLGGGWYRMRMVSRDASGRWSRTELRDGLSFCRPAAIHLGRSAAWSVACVGRHSAGPPSVDAGIQVVSGGSQPVRARTARPTLYHWTGQLVRHADGSGIVLTLDINDRVLLHTREGGAWQTEQVPGLSHGVLAIGPSGERVVAGARPDGTIRVVTDASGGWRGSDAGAGQRFVLAVGADGRIHIAVREPEPGRRWRLAVISGRPGAWTRSIVPGSWRFMPEALDEPSHQVFAHPDGSIVVVWQRTGPARDPDDGIFVSVGRHGSWTTRRLTRGIDRSWAAAMAPDGTLGVLREDRRRPWLSTLKGSVRTREPLPEWVRGTSALTFDPSGHPVVLGTRGSDSVVAWRDAGRWRWSPVPVWTYDTPGLVATDRAITILFARPGAGFDIKGWSVVRVRRD